MVVVRVQRARVFRHTPTAKIWAWIIKVLPFLLVLLVIFAMCFIAITRVSLFSFNLKFNLNYLVKKCAIYVFIICFKFLRILSTVLKTLDQSSNMIYLCAFIN